MTRRFLVIASGFLAIALVATVATAQIPYVDAVTADSPVAWWRMADATDSAGDNDGTPGSTSLFGVPGPIAGDTGGAAEFDGTVDSSIIVSDAPELNFDPVTDFSVEAWVYRSNSGVKQTIVNKGDTNGSFWLRWFGDDTFVFTLDYGQTGSSLQTANTFGVDQWHHVVATADRNDSMKIYVNGVLEEQVALVPAIEGGNISAPGFNLTVSEMDGGKFWNGGMDEFAMYGSALDASQVAAHYAAATGGDYATAVGADSPITWLRLGADGTDETGTHTTTVGSGVTFGQAGPIVGDTDGSALFDGSSDATVYIGDDPDLDFGEDGDFSLETWFYRDPSVDAYTAIAQKGDTHGAFWLRMTNEGKFQFLLDYDDTSSSLATPSAYDDGLWHHLVAVADRDASLQLFIDGDMVAETVLIQDDISSPGKDLQIGQLNGGTPFDGQMDEVALYDTALTLEQVQAHHSAAVVPEPTGILLLASLLGLVFLVPRNR